MRTLVTHFDSLGRRPLAALLLLATLVLGGVFHEWHHLQDPGCGTQQEESHHFCACSGMHASSLVATVVATPSPVTFDVRIEPAPARLAPIGASADLASPRAPPRG